jgi:hypothetical protein
MGSRYFALALQDAKCSLEAREPVRVLTSGSLFGSLVESLGGDMPAAAASSIAQARALVDEPLGLGWADYALGARAYFRSRFHEACEPLARAEATFRERCSGASREVMIVRIPLAISLRWAGRLPDVMAAIEQWGTAAREQGDLFMELWMQLLDIAPLCENRSKLARQRIEDAIVRLGGFVAQSASASSAAVVRLIGQVRRAEVDWYEGAYENAFQHIRWITAERGGDTAGLAPGTTEPDATRLPLHSMQLVWHRARAFCGALAARGGFDDELEIELNDLLAKHAAFVIPTMTSPALLHAAVALASGAREEAAEHLLEEAAHSERVHGNLERSACYRLQAGRVLSDVRGRLLYDRAHTELRALGVHDPQAWARVIAPGF